MKSPYLLEHRLADVLAAIQVMGSTTWDSRPIEDWQLVLPKRPLSAESWDTFFQQHPEFFGVRDHPARGPHYFLLLRRSYPKTIDPDTGRTLTFEELNELKSTGRYRYARLARRVLTPDQVSSLMDAAIELQVRAAALVDRGRWWIPLAAATLAFAGALLGSLLKAGQ
jgi:hypothetical protein